MSSRFCSNWALTSRSLVTTSSSNYRTFLVYVPWCLNLFLTYHTFYHRFLRMQHSFFPMVALQILPLSYLPWTVTAWACGWTTHTGGPLVLSLVDWISHQITPKMPCLEQGPLCCTILIVLLLYLWLWMALWTCFIHDSCLCPSSSSFLPVKPPCMSLLSPPS